MGNGRRDFARPLAFRRAGPDDRVSASTRPLPNAPSHVTMNRPLRSRPRIPMNLGSRVACALEAFRALRPLVAAVCVVVLAGCGAGPSLRYHVDFAHRDSLGV